MLTRLRFRPRQKVRLSEEGLVKKIATPQMKGVVLKQSGPLVTVKEDGFGAIADYHEDYLEIIPESK